MIIVADGPSAKHFVPPDGVPVIAVNGAIDWISRADHFFTLDHTEVNRNRLKDRRPGVKYHAAVPPGVGVPMIVKKYERIDRPVDDTCEPNEATPSWWFWRLGCVPGLATEKNKIHTGNSAYGALGLAYHLGARKVILVGVDGTIKPRLSGGRPGNLSHLGMLFASALPQIDVVSTGCLNTVPQMTFSRAMEWLEQ